MWVTRGSINIITLVWNGMLMSYVITSYYSVSFQTVVRLWPVLSQLPACVCVSAGVINYWPCGAGGGLVLHSLITQNNGFGAMPTIYQVALCRVPCQRLLMLFDFSQASITTAAAAAVLLLLLLFLLLCVCVWALIPPQQQRLWSLPQLPFYSTCPRELLCYQRMSACVHNCISQCCPNNASSEGCLILLI